MAIKIEEVILKMKYPDIYKEPLTLKNINRNNVFKPTIYSYDKYPLAPILKLM